MGFRQWAAWKLVQLAYRLHDPEYVEIIEVHEDTELVAQITVVGNEYGSGINSGFYPNKGGKVTVSIVEQ